MPDYPLSPEEFAERARSEKLVLMDELNALMHRKGFEAAQAMKAYYMVHIGGSRKNETQEERNLRAVMECLQQEYKTLEHNLSSLQSTLRAEREAANDYSIDR